MSKFKSELEDTLAAALDQDASIPAYEREFYFDRKVETCLECEGFGTVPGKRGRRKCRKCNGDGRCLVGRKWRLDFAWPERKLAVEVQGGTWTGGRHTRGSALRGEYEKLRAAARAGWVVLLFTRDDVLDGTAFREIKEWLTT